MTLDSLWVRRYHPAPADAPALVFLPHAGGSASYFHPVSAALSPAVATYAVQYPGRQDRMREPLVESVVELAVRLAEVLAPWLAETSVPVTLFGHSLGASVAYELQRILEADDALEPPVRVIASSRGAPDDERDLGIHTLDDQQLLGEVAMLAGTAPSILADDEMMQAFLPAIRNDYRAAETYRVVDPTPLRADVEAFTGLTDPRVTHSDVARWRAFTSGTFGVSTLPGGHFYLTDDVDACARRIVDVLQVPRESLVQSTVR